MFLGCANLIHLAWSCCVVCLFVCLLVFFFFKKKTPWVLPNASTENNKRDMLHIIYQGYSQCKWFEYRFVLSTLWSEKRIQIFSSIRCMILIIKKKPKATGEHFKLLLEECNKAAQPQCHNNVLKCICPPEFSRAVARLTAHCACQVSSLANFFLSEHGQHMRTTSKNMWLIFGLQSLAPWSISYLCGHRFMDPFPEPKKEAHRRQNDNLEHQGPLSSPLFVLRVLHRLGSVTFD